MDSLFRIRPAHEDGRDLLGLVEVLRGVVEAGAAVGFMLPFDELRARDFWAASLELARSGACVLLVAEDAARGDLVGTVTLQTAMPDNKPHRADVAKMQVHPRVQGLGLGRALLEAVESEARRLGRTLLVLDTATGTPAEHLYRGAGWEVCGVIPDYALYPDGRPCPATFLYRRLGS